MVGIVVLMTGVIVGQITPRCQGLTCGIFWPTITGMPRPPKDPEEKYDAAVRLRMRQADLELMKEAAARAGLSLSGWTRERLLRVAREEMGVRGRSK